MKGYVFDLEGNGFTPTKIHVVSYRKFVTELTDYGYKIKLVGPIKSIHDPVRMKAFFEQAECLVGHNIIQFDIPVVRNLLGVDVKARLIDTLPLSWAIFHQEVRHGLEQWGDRLGVSKPEITDWENLSLDEYTHRCEEDVEINTRLWSKLHQFLHKLYDDEASVLRYINYLAFKMDCGREQAERKWKLDREKAEDLLRYLKQQAEHKLGLLERGLPPLPCIRTIRRPAKPFRKDGSRSVSGARWFDALEERGLPEDYTGELEVITGYEPPNPGSHVQIKDWLYSLGWNPATFKYKRDKDSNEFRKIPQINQINSPELCSSVLELADVDPLVNELDGLGVLKHRISIVEGFLKNADENNYLVARIAGLTNTLRFKHAVLVNLPGVDKPYGKEIRGCLIADEGEVLCGSDQVSLEDRTKQHFMWDHDPVYVKEMQVEGFDPHLDIAILANYLTEAQVEAHKEGREDHKPIRTKCKTVNYSATYGIGVPSLARAMKSSEYEAKKLLETFWIRNWSINAVAEACEVKTVGGSKWLYNPVSKFWYSLRYEKDRFSTLNQGTGVYCFDTWVREVRKMGYTVIGQFHDEIITPIKDEDDAKETCRKDLKKAIDIVNSKLNLNIKLDVDIQFGSSYADIH